MNKAILVAAGLLPLFGAGAGAMAYMGVPPFSASADASPTVAEAKPIAVTVPPVFVDAGIVGVPVVKGGQVAKSVILRLQLDVDPASKTQIEASLPRLQDGFLTELMEFMPVHLKDRPQVDIAVIKRRLVKVCERVVGIGTVNDVLVLGIQER